MKTLFRTIKRRWAEYLIEILVLIIGISLSLFFNDWRAEQIDRKTEKHILQSIQENLIADTIMLDVGLKQLDFIIKGHKKMLAGEVEKDSSARYIDNFATYTMFKGQDVGYQELKQSQSSRIIQNRDLLKKIIAHYEQKLLAISEWGDIDEQFVLEEVLPFLNKNMTYSESNFLYDDYETTKRLLLNDNYFKNMIKSGRLFKEIIRHFHVKMKVETKVLIEEIEKELEK